MKTKYEDSISLGRSNKVSHRKQSYVTLILILCQITHFPKMFIEIINPLFFSAFHSTAFQGIYTSLFCKHFFSSIFESHKQSIITSLTFPHLHFYVSQIKMYVTTWHLPDLIPSLYYLKKIISS